MKNSCPRTLDKPLLMAGLELEELGVILAVSGGGGLLFGPIIPGLLAIILWIALIRFKRNKPAGYMVHMLYSKGMDLPGLIPPISKVQVYGC